ncbi:MAG TPA: hypothetical protein VFR18_26495 [Terriglobia bacterium]|nr:hypothetical protein [Terriglobia bacterium]
MSTIESQNTSMPAPSVVTVAHIVYALHAFAILTGIVGAATVIGSFVASIPSLAAVILNYVKRSDARGTWVYSHYRWQIHTFWWALLWGIIGVLSLIVFIGVAILGALTLWLIYRIVRGWLRLRSQRPMYSG